jgi:hypothetical protein
MASTIPSGEFTFTVGLPNNLEFSVSVKIPNLLSSDVENLFETGNSSLIIFVGVVLITSFFVVMVDGFSFAGFVSVLTLPTSPLTIFCVVS